MKIVFMGTPDFAVPCLARLLDDGHQILAVYTQPDKPKGRGNTLTPPPVKTLAQERGIPVYQPTKLRDGAVAAQLRALAPDLMVVVAYGRILPPDILAVPPLGCVNIHGSLLPKYRGAAPIQWTVLNGDPVGGVTSMYMAEGMDTGDMILRRETPVGPDETSGALFDRLAPLGADCLSRTVTLIAQGKAPRIPQDEAQATTAPMLEKEFGRLDFALDAQTLHNRIRGLSPWPGAFVTDPRGRLLKLHQSRVAVDTHTAAPGSILCASPLTVACGGGTTLELVVVQPEGKPRMAGSDYLNGARLAVGDSLCSP